MITPSQLLVLVTAYFFLGVGLTMIFGMQHPWGMPVTLVGMVLGLLGAFVVDARPAKGGISG